MAQMNIDYMEAVNSFYLALEENKSSEDMEILTEELSEFGLSEAELSKARAEASRLFSKNCF
jgi:hypothetical protein